MLCLLLLACWSSALADDPNLSPLNNTQPEEHSSVTATGNLDPWSRVVGDTEGAPGATRSSRLQGRRAAISLVENIRRQLMRDNYDYASDENEEGLLTKTTIPSETTSTERTTILTISQAPPVFQNKPATFPQRVTARRLPSHKTKSKVAPVQVARVSTPLKNIKGKTKSQSNNKSPQLRSMDMQLVRSGTPKPQHVKVELEVSKKDLLFYIDDSHLRRNNPDPGKLSLTRRYINDSIDSERSIKQDANEQVSRKNRNITSMKGSKDNTMQSLLNDEHNRIEFKSNLEAEKHDSQKLIVGHKDIEKMLNKNGESPKQQLVDIDIKGKKNQDSQVTERGKYLEELDERVTILESQTGTKNSSEKNQNNDQQNKMQKKQVDVSQESFQNSTEELELQPNDEKTTKIDNPLNYRRSNRHRRSRKRTTKSTTTSDDSYDSNSSDGDDSEPSTEEVHHKRYKNNKHTKKRKKHVQISKSRKQNQHKKTQKKKVKVAKQSYDRSVEQLQSLRKSKKGGQKINMKKKTRIISRKSNENDIETSNETEKPSVEDKESHKTVKSVTAEHTSPSTLRCTHTVHQHDTTQETKIKVENENLNNNNVISSSNLGGENTTPADLKGEQNEVKDQKKDDFNEYVDSMDNEDLNDINGRRMNTVTNKTQSKDLNKTNSKCNSIDGCAAVGTSDGMQETVPTAKYKLLKVKAKGGSRRSRLSERQFIQERGPNGVVLIALDDQPFPQFRLPRSRRQYMFEQGDKRPPSSSMLPKSPEI